MTKLKKILEKNNISNVQLIELIENKTGHRLYPYMISKIANGLKINYSLKTACLIAHSLGLPIDAIVEKEKLINDKKDTK